jgi:hypothetical protein
MKLFSLTFAALALASIAGAIFLQLWHPLIIVAIVGTMAYVCYFADKPKKPLPQNNPEVFYRKGDKIKIYENGSIVEATITDPHLMLMVKLPASRGEIEKAILKTYIV